MMMMMMPEVTGAATSRAARKIRWSVGRLSGASASWLSTFSTTTTAASTNMPMAMARPPRLIRLADSPKMRISNEGGQGREGQHQGDHQRRAQVAEEGEEQQDHQHDGLEQRFGYGADGAVDQVAAIVEGLDGDALGQGRGDLGQPGLDAFDHRRALAPRRPRTRPCTASPWPLRVTAP
jgi:hypothetical protein